MVTLARTIFYSKIYNSLAITDSLRKFNKLKVPFLSVRVKYRLTSNEDVILITQSHYSWVAPFVAVILTLLFVLQTEIATSVRKEK